MEFFQRAARQPRRLGIFPGTFNPPTRAHVALAEAALEHVDEVLLVMPRVLPHKSYQGVGLQDRLRMLECVVSSRSRCSLAVTERGLFLDIARECRDEYGPDTSLALICGKDAAERALSWDYEQPDAVNEMLSELFFMVADRGGAFHAPRGFESRVRSLLLARGCEDICASQVRESVRSGKPWEHLVPEEIAALVRELYGK